MLTVVGMGRADGDVTLSGLRAIESADRVIIKSRSTFMTKFMQNRKIAFCDLDEIYQQAENFDELNTLIVDKLVAMSGEFGKVVFCVTGSGSDDTTVARLIDSGIDFEMVSGVGFEESVLTIASPTCYQTFTATQLLEGGITSACATVVKYIDDFMVAGQVKLALLNVFDFDTPVKFYDGKTIKDILLVDLDRQKYNYRATILIEPKNFRNKSIFTFEDVVKIIKILRAPGGCPWDSAQTHESIKANAIEEAYELSNAIEKQDLSNMVEELGDAILVTILHIAIGEGEGEFCLADVLSALGSKLIGRHSHIFGLDKADNATVALSTWERNKAKEHNITSVKQNLLDVPYNMSALMRAKKVRHRAAKAGYEFASMSGAVDKIREELDEVLEAFQSNDNVATQKELGDLLFAVVNICEFINAEPETALTDCVNRFVARVCYIEDRLALQDKKLVDLPQEEFDALWEDAKIEENKRALR